jgi:hypothetical protein
MLQIFWVQNGSCLPVLHSVDMGQQKTPQNPTADLKRSMVFKHAIDWMLLNLVSIETIKMGKNLPNSKYDWKGCTPYVLHKIGIVKCKLASLP